MIVTYSHEYANGEITRRARERADDLAVYECPVCGAENPTPDCRAEAGSVVPQIPPGEGRQ